MTWMLTIVSLFALGATREISLSAPANLRSLKNQILEVEVQVPMGTKISLDSDAAPIFNKFRDSKGQVKESTNGFFPIQWNKQNLFLSSIDVNAATDSSAEILPLPAKSSPNAGYLKYFSANGKRLRDTYSARLAKRFGSQYNREIPMSSLTPADQAKWNAIYWELVQIADRTRTTPRRNLFISSGSATTDKQMAEQFSEQFETSGKIQNFGAWTIAVLGTAPRNGFPNVPCAEFMSEVIRQAYTKAGYNMASDFRGKNYLIWSNTAAVVNLAQALYESGWIPWDAFTYKPVTGAIAMHAAATTPGHTYLIAGLNGRFLVDNGSPNGRDLYKTNINDKDYIGLMYDIGVFFLPPGVIPERW